MNRRRLLRLLGGVPLLPHAVQAQISDAPKDVVSPAGAWVFVSSTIIHPDDRRTDFWGPTAKGMLIMDPDGHFIEIIQRVRSGLQYSRSLFRFGTYAIDQSGTMLTRRIEGSSRQSAIGKTQVLTIISLSATEFKYLNPATSTDDKLEVIWKR